MFGFFTFCFVIYKIFKRSNSRYNNYNRQPCLIVGLPCGQFQGASNVDKLAKIFFMRRFVSGVPIMMDERQALMASMFRTLLGRTTVLLVEFNPTESWERAGIAYSPSSSMETSSWTSEASKTVSLLKGTAVSAKREVEEGVFFSSRKTLPRTSKTSPAMFSVLFQTLVPLRSGDLL